MTAPVWFASPPEVHSALLSSGPGPGPLLASAEAWGSLSTAYTEAAEELSALVSDVVAGTWDGPTADAYAAAHAPYLDWLAQSGADSAATSAQQHTAAGAYTTALAAMPTLAELAANHATHAVLLATNFFGVNTIPIALNEADYARMWVQAATTMSTYQGVTGAAVAASPQTAPAPQIVKAADATEPSPPPAWFEQLQSSLEGLFPQPPYPDTGDFPLYQQILTFFNQIGFTDVADPLANFFQSWNGSSWLPPLGVPGSWLAYTGDPLSYLNPATIAYVLSVPLDPGSYAAFTGIVIVDDMLAIVYTAAVNPQALVLVAPLAFVEIVGSTIGNTIQLLHYVVEQTVIAVLPTILPLMTSALVPLAAAPVGATGLAGLAGLAGVAPVAAPPAPPTSFGMAMAAPGPSVPAPASPAPPPAPAAPGPAPAPPSPAAGSPPPTPAGPPPATMPGMLYMVGDLGLGAQRTLGTSSPVRKAPTTDTAETAGAAPTPDAPVVPRRRRAKAQMPGRGYEYMDLEPVTVSDQGAGMTGFPGTAPTGRRAAAGLTALAGDGFADAPVMPMMPGTWDAD